MCGVYETTVFDNHIHNGTHLIKSKILQNEKGKPCFATIAQITFQMHSSKTKLAKLTK